MVSYMLPDRHAYQPFILKNLRRSADMKSSRALYLCSGSPSGHLGPQAFELEMSALGA
jgi:hypothetical protein